LLADTEGKITEKYGAKMTGRDLARRVSFLINQEGKIVHVTDNPSAEVHLKEMEEAVAKLSK
jgi:peroxiredoxin